MSEPAGAGAGLGGPDLRTQNARCSCRICNLRQLAVSHALEITISPRKMADQAVSTSHEADSTSATTDAAAGPVADAPGGRDAASASVGVGAPSNGTDGPEEADREDADGEAIGASGSLAAWFDRSVFTAPDFDASVYVDDMSPYVSAISLPPSPLSLALPLSGECGLHATPGTWNPKP